MDHVIPTPEVFPVSDKHYDELYPPTFKIPRQLIHVQLPSYEKEYSEYDLDSEDEEWLNQSVQKNDPLNISKDQFEEMIELLENECPLDRLDKVEQSDIIAVQEYWLTKKFSYPKSLLPVVKTEKRDATSGNNPYIAFRRRTEKMQTRKNRKNDESSYEKMLKLERDFRAVR